MSIADELQDISDAADMLAELIRRGYSLQKVVGADEGNGFSYYILYGENCEQTDATIVADASGYVTELHFD